jgi:hypothetical protein
MQGEGDDAGRYSRGWREMRLLRESRDPDSIRGRRRRRFYLAVALGCTIVVAGIGVGAYALSHGFSAKVGRWTKVDATGELPAAGFFMGTYDVVARQAITYYGRDSVSHVETWAYSVSNATFHQMMPSGESPNILASTVVYDQTAGKTIAYGIVEGGGQAETWAFDSMAGSWANLKPALSPPPMNYPCMAYDGALGKVVLFEGFDGHSLEGRTWAYDGTANSWFDLKAEGAPPVRNGVGMAYDESSGCLLLFGGMPFAGAGPEERSDETWAYDSDENTWTEMIPPASPPARTGAMMVYDRPSGKVILFGGWSYGGLFGDTWAYDSRTNTWEELNTAGSPGVRAGSVMFYDQVLGKIILCGGAGKGRMFGDAWEFSL